MVVAAGFMFGYGGGERHNGERKSWNSRRAGGLSVIGNVPVCPENL